MGHSAKYTPGKDYSLEELKKLIRAQGWTIESKGSSGHLVARKEGHTPFDIPTAPSKKTKHSILKSIGLK